MASSYQRRQNKCLQMVPFHSQKMPGGAGSISLGFVPVYIDIASEFSIDFAEKFSDDAVLPLVDAGSAGSAGFALVFPLTLASSSGFLCIFFDGLVNVAMVDLVNVAMDNLAKILFCFDFVS
jgi:predicted amidohydrolase